MVEYPQPQLTPEEFELFVKVQLDEQSHELAEYVSKHREILGATDGEYEIDVTVRFSAFGVNYLTLIECKHYKKPVGRDKVQTLLAKVQSLGAQKGILYSTSGFQSGAVKFASAHGIALIEISDGRSAVLAKAYPPMEIAPLPPVAWLIQDSVQTLLDGEDGRRLSLVRLAEG